MFFIVVGSLFTELVLKHAYRKVLGVLAMAALAVLAFGGSAWIWDNVDNDDAVSAILVLLGLGAAFLIARSVMKLPIANRPVQIGLVVVVAALGVWAAVALAGLDLGESAADVPTMLFGLGAIALVSEPRGVVYDIVNRQRLRQFQDAERHDEDASLQADEGRSPRGCRRERRRALPPRLTRRCSRRPT